MQLDHSELFAGQEVQIINAGVYVGEFPVSDTGAVEYADAAGKTLIGYGYVSQATSLPSAAQGPEGMTYGASHRVREIRPYVLDTASLYISTSEEAPSFALMSSSLSGFTRVSGFQRTDVLSNFSLDSIFSLQTAEPLPCTVVSAVITLD